MPQSFFMPHHLHTMHILFAFHAFHHAFALPLPALSFFFVLYLHSLFAVYVSCLFAFLCLAFSLWHTHAAWHGKTCTAHAWLMPLPCLPHGSQTHHMPAHCLAHCHAAHPSLTSRSTLTTSPTLLPHPPHYALFGFAAGSHASWHHLSSSFPPLLLLSISITSLLLFSLLGRRISMCAFCKYQNMCNSFSNIEAWLSYLFSDREGRRTSMAI